ncbi:MAG: hypothetical protein EOR98_35385 [Mesorhizobium sp.]|nr:MAG: hypothetical protein EOR98_35385 [Mesorhizobium sp.]
MHVVFCRSPAVAWLGLAWLGLAWLGLAWLGLAWQDVWLCRLSLFVYSCTHTVAVLRMSVI